VSFTNTEPQNHMGENTWFTPKVFIDYLGPFDLDPCTVSYRPFDTAKKHIERDRGGCGIAQEWSGDVWLNPPYGKEILPFIEKFISHKEGILLIFSRMGSEGVQRLVRSGANFYFLRERVKFIQKEGNKVTNAGTDSMLVFFDNKYYERAVKFNGVLIKQNQIENNGGDIL
jgi:hypothetical protein